MDRQEFYSELVKKLTELGIEPDTARKHVKKIDKFFAGLSEDEVNKRIADLGNADDFAMSMYEIIKDKRADSKGNALKSDAAPASGTDSGVYERSSEDVSNSAAGFSDDAASSEKAEVVKSDVVYDITNLNIPITRRSATAELDDVFGKEITERQMASEVIRTTRADADMSDSFTDETLIMDSSAFKKILSPEEEKRLKNNKILFWTALVLTSPIWIFALLLVAVLFGCIFFAVGAVTLALVLLMLGTVIAGTGTSLFGIIYGITQLSVRPVGLYEIGLGIMIAGATMIIGILLYNFTVRIMPFAYKYVIKFTKFTIGKIKELFKYIRKECIGE